MDDAKRILRELKRWVSKDSSEELPRNWRPVFDDFFINPCRWSPGCHEIDSSKRELEPVKRELEKVFYNISNIIKSAYGEGDEDKANRIKHRAFQLLRGHCPTAARMIERIPKRA